MKAFAVVGIHTDIGKTIVSAVITEALGCDYWKPVQAGSIDQTDTMTVQSLVSNSSSKFHDERYLLAAAMSPHAAAERENIRIDLEELRPIKTTNNLLIETAGGLMSPMNHESTMLDYVVHYNLPVLFVSRAYLGSINHTLLCLEMLAVKKIKLLAMIYSGDRNEESESFIATYTKVEKVIHVPMMPELNAVAVKQEAERIQPMLRNYLEL